MVHIEAIMKKVYGIRIELGILLTQNQSFINFINRIPRPVGCQSTTRTAIRKALAQFNGAIVYVPHPLGTNIVLYFENEAAYGMYLLKYS